MLTLLANPLHGRILRAHAEGPLRMSELVDRAELPPQTTLRAALATLREAGFLGRREVTRMPYGVATELTEAGREALFALEVVEGWLGRSPDGPIPVDSDRAKAAIKALAGGWNSTVILALAIEPASLTELDSRIAEMSYPSLERRLSSLRATHQVEPVPSEERRTRYAVTNWTRHSVAPLCVAGRCERLYMREESAPITAIEIETSFLLAIQLVPPLPEGTDGSCVLSVLPEAGEHGEGDPRPAGVTIEVENGKIVSCVPEVPDEAPLWALGTPMDWLNAVIDGRLASLRFGGNSPQLAADLVNGLHLALFGSSGPEP